MGCIISIKLAYKTINLKQLTLKVTLLLSLFTGQRLQTLRCMELQHIDFTNNSCVIHILKVLKTTKPGKHIPPIVLNLYDIENLCILWHLSRYRELTSSLRSHPDRGSLLISFKKPHYLEDTLSRWISLKLAGVDTSVFTAHSTRSHPASCLLEICWNFCEILQQGYRTECTNQ